MKRILLMVGLCLAAPHQACAGDEKKDLVDTAVAAGSFKTLVTAVTAAELVETLKGTGPFTVFAPTDEAFAAVPKEKLAALLKDKKALTGVLTYHVVAGRLLAADVVKLESAKTVQGKPLKITAKDGKVSVNGANVIKTDIQCSNGVIHVIDAVLLPPDAPAPSSKLIRDTLKETEGQGASAQLALFRDAVAHVRRLASANQFAIEALQKGEKASVAAASEAAAAAALRSALQEADDVLSFRPLMEAKLPHGFPEPTPVGEIHVKRYPAYRLARASMPGRASEGRAFFTLFEHITRNGVEMTAPVELTYGAATSDRPQGEAMAFLYESIRLGKTGKDGAVTVVDVPAMTAVSIGVRGNYTEDKIADAQERLQRWLEENRERYERAGPLRVMGYNSPMVPAARRYAEVQIPIREKK